MSAPTSVSSESNTKPALNVFTSHDDETKSSTEQSPHPPSLSSTVYPSSTSSSPAATVSGGATYFSSTASSSAQSSPSSYGGGGGAASKKPCSFFAMGTCRNGDSCRFSHEPPQQQVQQPYREPPPPLCINIPPGVPVFSIDVECVATGAAHNARSVAQVALVNEWGQPVFNILIRQDAPVVSYITPLTGLTKELIEQYGIPMG